MIGWTIACPRHAVYMIRNKAMGHQYLGLSTYRLLPVLACLLELVHELVDDVEGPLAHDGDLAALGLVHTVAHATACSTRIGLGSGTCCPRLVFS